MKNRLYLLTALFSILLMGCSNKEHSTSLADSEIIPVKTMALSKQTVQRPIFTSGQFTTDDEAYLGFKTGGVIDRIFVKEGDAIRKGQLLATLNLGEIKSMVQQAQTGYDKALRDHERVTRLHQDSVATLEQLQNTRSALELAREQLAIARFNLNYSEIRAQNNGFVLRKLASEGQIAGPGTPVLQTNGAGRGNWLLKVAVSDHEWAMIQPGDKATLAVDLYPGQNYQAHVYSKSEGVDPYTGTFSIHLKPASSPTITIANGLFGKAQIFPHSPQSAWIVPYDAVLDGDGNTGYVFITNDKMTVQKIKVTIASIDKEQVYVSEGLEGAPWLITAGSAYLKDHTKIRIVE